MIRFFDTEAVSIELEQYDRDEILQYFLRGGIEPVLIYNQAEYYGLATYKSVLKRSGENGILLEKYEMCPKSDLFSDLYAIFKETSSDIEYIPVFRADMQLLYFAYEFDINLNGMEDAIFTFLEHERECLFLEDLYPQIKKVCIYDFNEFAFRFYKVLKARNFPVEVFGEKWQLFYPELYEREQVRFGTAVYEGIMNIYAEGTAAVPKKRGAGKAGYQIGETWEFLWNIVTANSLFYVEKLKRYLREKKVLAFTMLFPCLEELDDYSVDEYYRHTQRIDPYSIGLQQNRRDLEQINKCWCDSEESSIDDKIRRLEEREQKSVWESGITIEDTKVEYKDYGTGTHILYVIGPCIVRGLYVDAEDAFGNYLYKEIQKYQKDYRVRCIAVKRGAMLLLEKTVKSLTLREGDIVILVDHNRGYQCSIGEKISGYPGDVDVKGILARRKSDWFWDWPIHTNQRGNIKIAQALAEEYLKEHLWEDSLSREEPRILQAGQCFLSETLEEEIRQYIEEVKVKVLDSALQIGAVVMNCNPMTKGHRYLIEQALQYVDFLYIFLVEEDRSEVAFADRLEMVRAVTRKYKNVKAVPSGRFVLSYETMPIYFEKAEKQEEKLDAAQDLKIFGEKIAPKLGIKIRLVGEEPKDRITKQYNEAMKKILPLYGVQLVEMPRIEMDNEAISASIVRKHLRRGELDRVRRLVPEEVYQYLIKRGTDILRK